MITRFIIILVVTLLAATAGIAQSPTTDGRGAFPRPDDPDGQPKNVREMLDKLKIEEEKKNYDEMLDRGSQALKLSEEVEKAFASEGALTNDSRSKIDTIEKLTKKIRSELGGADSDETESPDDADIPPKSQADAVEMLSKLTDKMVGELKKTTRFSISAAAIQSTNAVLKVTRFLRGK